MKHEGLTRTFAADNFNLPRLLLNKKKYAQFVNLTPIQMKIKPERFLGVSDL